MKHRRALWLVLVGALAALGLAVAGGPWRTGEPRSSLSDRPLGLFTSLPLLWTEAADIKALIDAPAAPHWARAVIEANGRLVPLDTLLDLHQVDALIVAQPRPLVPEENVALDEWVRGGGQVLMFADPMLTQESAFPLGDRRRPQDVVLLSPILARWGLDLRFDESQPAGVRENAGEALPVNLSGTFALRPGGEQARCVIGPEALVARCDIGKGRATIVADAALLESGHDSESRAGRLQALIAESLGR